MTGAPTAYDFWGPYNNTVFYGSPMPPHYPYMPASEIGAPVAFDFPDHYNTLSYGLPILPHYPYTQASTTIGTSFPYYFPDCHDTVSYGPPMPPHYPYTQAAPTIGASLSYNFPGCQNTEVSRGSLGQYNLQVNCHSMSDSRRTHLLLLLFSLSLAHSRFSRSCRSSQSKDRGLILRTSHSHFMLHPYLSMVETSTLLRNRRNLCAT